MKYVEPKEISREDAETAFKSGSPAAICHALVNLTYFEEDWRWVQDLCLRYAQDSDKQIAGAAISCLGHIARIHKKIDREKVVPMLTSFKEDSSLKGRAEDALEDISIFVKK